MPNFASPDCDQRWTFSHTISHRDSYARYNSHSDACSLAGSHSSLSYSDANAGWFGNANADADVNGGRRR